MLLGGHTRCFHMHEYLVVLAYESFAIVGIDAGNTRTVVSVLSQATALVDEA